MIDLFMMVVVSGHCRSRQQNAGNSTTEDRSHKPEGSEPQRGGFFV
jgi:hypothetical protein